MRGKCQHGPATCRLPIAAFLQGQSAKDPPGGVTTTTTLPFHAHRRQTVFPNRADDLHWLAFRIQCTTQDPKSAKARNVLIPFAPLSLAPGGLGRNGSILLVGLLLLALGLLNHRSAAALLVLGFTSEALVATLTRRYGRRASGH